MYIIELSPELFPELRNVENFFNDYLNSDARLGRFRVAEGELKEDGLRAGERLVFTYDNWVRYIVRAASERLDNEDELSDEYPYVLMIDVETLHPIGQISLDDVGQVVDKPDLGKTGTWEKVPEDSALADSIWNLLLENTV
jgi:hypothetical protein